jgi:putative drug exporter of the RND superfamily
MLNGIVNRATGRRSRWWVIGAWVLVALVLLPLQPKLADLASNENEAFLAGSAESTRANDLLDERFALGQEVTAIVAYHRPGGLTEADNQQIAAEAKSLCDSRAIPDLKAVVTAYGMACGEMSSGLEPETGPALVSADGSTMLVTVETTNEATAQVVADVATLRTLVPDPGAGGPQAAETDAGGLSAYVTGPAAFTADASEAFEGIDQLLLAITMALVLVALLLTYRSPVLAALPLLVVGIAYVIAAAIAYGLAKAGAFQVTGQATAILIVLMFGAGTDYCLLLVSRCREVGDAGEAARRTAPAILSAGGVVVAALLVLAVADVRATAWMGPVLAIGIAVMALAGLTLLPALLSLVGPRTAPETGAVRPVWSRIGSLVRARPGAITAAVLAVLAVGALGNFAKSGTLDFTEAFREPPESVRALALNQDEFGPGRAAPLDLVVATPRAPDVLAALDGDPAVVQTTMVSHSRDERLLLASVELKADPFSDAATAQVPHLRDVVRRAAGGDEVLLGGVTAETFDSREAQAADARLVAPLTIGVILLIVIALVRALVAPLYLVASVLLSYGFALGVASLVFGELDPGLPLFAFIFLVALGADYNIFLIGRIRDERARMHTKAAVIEGLQRTGGVITSAGLILAGTFAALIALPVEGIAQMGFTIAFGVLVDAFLVRTFLVPGIAVLLGERNWWPRGFALRRNRDLVNVACGRSQ